MVKAKDILKEIEDILQVVQYNNISHPQNLAKLRNLYKKTNVEVFQEAFFKFIDFLLFFEYKVPNSFVDRSLDFLASFCVSVNVENEWEPTCLFLAETFNYVLEYHNVEEVKIRYRICQFINLLLHHLGDDGSLDDYLCDNIRDTMMERMLDVKVGIRLQAVNLLQRLQDPQDLDDPVIKQYLHCITDRNPQVRKKIIQCIAPNMTSMPILISRCLDVDYNVRFAVYQKLSKVPVRILKIVQRQKLLKNGFRDESPKIKKFIDSTLLPQWLECYNGDILNFMLALKLDADKSELEQTLEILEKVLTILFKKNSLDELISNLPLNDNKLIPPASLSWELVVYWKFLVKYFSSGDEDLQECVNKMLPDLTEFTHYVREVYNMNTTFNNTWEMLQHEHILKELFQILQTFDYSDEVGRNTVHKLVTDILTETKVSFEIVEVLVEILEIIVPNTDERTAELSSLISDIREPMVEQPLDEHTQRIRDVKLAEIRVQLNICKEDLDIAIRGENFEKAHQLKMTISELEKKMEDVRNTFTESTKKKVVKEDSNTLMSCINIMVASLKSPTVTSFSVPIRLMHSYLIVPLLRDMISDVYIKAFQCHCLCCLLDKKMAVKEFQSICLPIIASKLMDPCNEVLFISISCFTDFIILFGFGSFEEEQNSNDEMDQNDDSDHIAPRVTCKIVLEIISHMLDDENEEIREKACESLVKLFGNGLIRSPVLLTKLILKWFNPASARDTRLLQMLGNMFLDYATEIADSTEVIEQSFIPILKAVADAPENSPLIDIDIDSLIKFLCEISRPGRNKYNKNADSHKHLSIFLCSAVLKKKNEKYFHIYIKALLHLEVPYEDNIVMQNLLKQANEMLKMHKKKAMQTKISKYIQKLNRIDFASSTTDNLTTGIASSVTLNTISENGNVSAKSIKRRKRRSRNTSNTTSSSAINGEKAAGSEDDDNISIESVDSDKRDEIPVMNHFVISESDSDFE